MPANPKYLTTSPWLRFAKISAGLAGGYLLTTCLHLALAAWFDPATVLITSTFTTFILWAVIMVLAFLARNGWIAWGFILLASIVCTLVFLLGNPLTS